MEEVNPQSLALDKKLEALDISMNVSGVVVDNPYGGVVTLRGSTESLLKIAIFLVQGSYGRLSEKMIKEELKRKIVNQSDFTIDIDVLDTQMEKHSVRLIGSKEPSGQTSITLADQNNDATLEQRKTFVINAINNL